MHAVNSACVKEMMMTTVKAHMHRFYGIEGIKRAYLAVLETGPLSLLQSLQALQSMSRNSYLLE